MKTVQGVDYAVMALYLLLMVWVGLFYARYMKSLSHYFAGGNAIPWWLAGVSFYMTSFSAVVFVAYAGVAYQYGMEAITLIWLVAPSCIVGSFALGHLWRRAGILSPAEFLETRYNAFVRQLLVWANVPLLLVDNGIRIYATGIFLNQAVGLSIAYSVIVVSVVMVLYTFLGGLWAVSVTDFIQFIILATALVVILPLSISAVGGVGGLVKNSPPGFFQLTQSVDGFYLATFFILFFVSYNTRWALVQRYYCVRTEADARKVGLLAGALYIIGPVLWSVPVFASRQILPKLENPDFAFAALATKILPAGFTGLVLAAILSATMSTISAEYNVIAGVVTRDFYQRYIEPRASERRLVWLGRFFTLVIGVAVTLIALAVSYSQTRVFDLMVKALAISLGPAGVPVLMGLVYRKPSWKGAAASFFAGICTVAIFEFFLRPTVFQNFSTKQFWAVSTFSYITVPFLTIILSPLFFKPCASEAERVKEFFGRLRTPLKIRDEIDDKIPSPFFIVGIVTFGMGCLLCLSLPFINVSFDRWVTMFVSLGLLVAGATMYLKSRKDRQLLVD